MCTVKQPHTVRVKRSLEMVVPSCVFDDVVLEYLAKSLEGDGPVSEDVLVEQWSPFLYAAGACKDEDQIRGLCHSLLANIQSDAGTLGKELMAWLEKLQLLQYADRSIAWCEKKDVHHLNEMLDRWHEFVDDLSFKPLERKRVQRYVDSNGKRFVPEIPKTAASPVNNIVTKASASTKPDVFGPDEDPERYRLLEEIGRGATAVVYRCASAGKMFAVKSIGLTKLKLQKDYKRVNEKLQREVSILFKLKHKRIVALFDVVEQPDRALHLVMDLVEGGDLFTKIVKHESFSEEAVGPKPSARHVFAQICDALLYVHSQDIVHRDLKPENILVDEKASRGSLLEVKLSDFGHSKLIDDGYSLALSAGVGTPQYWAPEVCDPRKAALGYNQQVDLWSLGVVLYVMLIGAYPFSMDKSIEKQAEAGNYAFKPPDGTQVSPEAKDLVKALIKVDPHQRLALRSCLLHPWVNSGGNATFLLAESVSSEQCQFRVQLPVQPTKTKVQMLRSALVEWEKKFCCSATVKHKEVIVVLSCRDDDKKEQAQRELTLVLQSQFPALSGAAPVSALGSGYHG